mgnify:CR=1 FL=1
MIYSDKQYGISTSELFNLKEALAATSALALEGDWLKALEIDGLKSQITELEADIAHYDLLKSGEITFAKSFSLSALPSILIQARIAANMSQTDLAVALGVKPQQVQRYEASEYMGASLAKLIAVSEILNVHTEGLFETEAVQQGAIYSWGAVDELVWQQFPVKEMAKRRWFDVPQGANVIESAKAYFLKAAGPQFATALHRKKIRGTTLPNEYSLLAWQARILERARIRMAEEAIPEFSLDDSWLPELVALTRQKDGPKRARQLLAHKGIVLVTEEHLQGTYLDGAAMLSDGGQPVIGMTLRYDRLDNFWFVLFHELGHVFLHLYDGLHFDFFDEEGSKSGDRVEDEADQFALNQLIPEDIWDQCLSRFALSVEAVQLDADALGVDASIIAGRIRKEQNNYVILSDLVGHKLVRAQLMEAEYDLE